MKQKVYFHKYTITSFNPDLNWDYKWNNMDPCLLISEWFISRQHKNKQTFF